MSNYQDQFGVNVAVARRPVIIELVRKVECTLPPRHRRASTSATDICRSIDLEHQVGTVVEATPPPVLTTGLDDAFSNALSACHDYPGQRFFQDRTENRLAVLTPAYRLALEIVRGGAPAFDLAASRMSAGLRQRALSRDKPELLAVQVAAKPETSNQRKQCSALASLLMVARVKGLTVEAFPEWASDADLEECRAKAKRIRSALRAGVAPDLDDDSVAEPEVEAPWVQVVYGRGTQTVEIFPASLPLAAETRVAELIGAGVAADTLPNVLRRIADFLEGVVETSLPPTETIETGKAPATVTPANMPKPTARPISPRDILRGDDPLPF
ncbi:hypothetical protein PMNALOAF_1818 [Methylobacterium adhaesivum]|uniref:Uncharacterized protein n=1 Tax=Methylobacterium adhaesivum TaxID=333297 RepID=A0ABT8BDT8_9HYPH|nr:hypothetical protein [Methylobacterium adhaesivum]MDN3589556.1 hypothetical protein [Methylobacterium adhaesivum]GJD30571.1 hypothetical protein PMNALOAF_1818 [Methylobacterium adhaesivum]